MLRVTIAGKRRDMGLCAYPEVTLAQARDKARAARELIRQGLAPIARQQAAQSAMRAAVAEALTFKDCAGSYIKAHRAGWQNARHAQQWGGRAAWASGRPSATGPAKRSNYPRDVAEMALANAIGDKVEAACRRGELLEKRRLMMADWAQFLARMERPAEAIELQGRRA